MSASSFLGTFKNFSTSQVLNVTVSDDNNGKLEGNIKNSDGTTLSVTGHYHWIDVNAGTQASMAFIAITDDPNNYQAWAGLSSADHNTLNMCGGGANGLNPVRSLDGSWERV